MRNLVEHILNREYDAAKQIFESEIETVTEIKLNEAKKMVAARMAEQVPAFMGAAAGNAVKLRRGVLEEDDLDEMQIGKSSGISSMAKNMRLNQEPKWHETNKNLRGFSNPEPRLPNADPHKFKSNTPVYSVAPNKQAIAKYVKPNLEEESEEQQGGVIKKAQDYVDKSDAERKRNNDGKLDPDEQKFANKITGRNDEIVYPNKPLYSKTNMKEESEELDEARIKIQKARVRGGKIERRRKVSNVEGHKIVDGKLKRMSPAERRRRKLGAKRGKLKRRSKMRLALMKRKRSLRKRASIGL